ncbi:MAG: hypothetical protein MMC23_002502 [Stictis urceolatum]|nr:hypothetical protein [Stictis urceolata]
MAAPSIQLLRALRRATSLPQSYSISQARPLLNPICRSNGFSTKAQLLAGPPKSRDRGPASQEDTQTDFGTMNVLANTPPPSTSIDACLSDGFHLDNGLKISDGSGCLLISGEAFSWRPWEATGGTRNAMINSKGQWNVGEIAWGALDLVWPKPGLSLRSTLHDYMLMMS